ncbi:MAG: PEP-CTERM sorting domain-containing protein [Planctomycetota bacterium]
MIRSFHAALLTLMVVLTLFASSGNAHAELFINEIFWDPPSAGGDLDSEYIELRGTPGASLDDHFLIFLESEGNDNSGNIDNIFNLSGMTLGSNGFLSLRQKDNPYSVIAGGNNLENTGSLITSEVLIFPPNPTIVQSPPGWGNGAGFSDPDFFGGETTVGASDSIDPLNILGTTGRIENAAFSALLIKNVSGADPVVDEDLDVGNDGLDVPTGKVGWEIIDSIGVVNESAESSTAVVYGQVNFLFDDVPAGFVPNMPAGATFQLLPYELEIAARWGNSTGQTPADWHISNLTDDTIFGPTAGGNFRQSTGDPKPNPALLESNQNVPFGTILTNTIGGPNFLTGDFNRDGVVDVADYTVWRDSLGDTLTGGQLFLPADHNNDGTVDIDDYLLWKGNLGAPFNTSAPGAASLVVPEPASWLLLIAIAGISASRRRVR